VKKVLFVASVAGHIKNFHTPYLKLFKDKGYTTYVAANWTLKENEKIDFCDNFIQLPIERKPFSLKNIKAICKLKKLLKVEKFDLIHCHTPMGSVVARLSAKSSRKKGTKVVYTAHGFHFYKGAPLKNWIIYYPVEKICSRWTDCLITITNEDYKFAKKHFKNIKKIEHVNGVGMNAKRLEKGLTESEKNDIRENLKIKSDDIVFSYVAELNSNKNQMLLIHIIERLKDSYPNIKLLLIGNGPLKERYKEYIDENNLNEFIKLLGKRNDINELLSITDIYMASSKREGLPVNIMEAMYKGIPIVATDNRGHREIAMNSKNIFIEKDITEMEQKVIDIISNMKNYKELSQEEHNDSKKYSIESVIERMNEIYADLLS
jgi:glycosyltransferase, family 1